MSATLVRFAVLGGLAFAARGAWDAVRPESAAFREAAGATSHAPDDEALFARAVALGLDETDPVVYRRLVANLRFLEPATRESDDALAREARALGMDRTDPVVRRRLVNVMRLRLEADARAAEPTDDELRAHLAAHAERWRQPARVRVEHVFFSAWQRGDSAARDAVRASDALGAGAVPGELGDAFPEDVTTGLRSERELARVLGPEVARAALAAAGGAWSGPVQSAYGAHLVRVTERVPAAAPTLDAVRGSVREDLLAARAAAALPGLPAVAAPPRGGGS